MLAVLSVPVDLRAEVDRALEGFSHEEIPQTEVLGQGMGAVGDPARVRQILRNLLSNAFRHGGEHVQVRIGGDGRVATVSVVDDGPGVSGDEADRIFEPYHRSGADPGQPASLGLGLSISRQLARLMGGDLTYRYEADTAIFQLDLPETETGGSATITG